MQRRHKTYSGALPQLRTLEVQGINAKRCKLIQRGDGYSYGTGAGFLPGLECRVSAPKE
ncbi:MAG: hypothetical protein J2P21_04975 [Chloracidobacterium sp.]|nr:hypothetical protein [Chloracidobacterium sp.]